MAIVQNSPDQDNVVSRLDLIEILAIEPGDHAVEYRRTGMRPLPADSGKLVGARGGETIG